MSATRQTNRKKMLFSRLRTNTTVLDKVASLEVRSSVNARVGICHSKIDNKHAPCYKCCPIKLFQLNKKTSQVPFEQLTFRLLQHPFEGTYVVLARFFLLTDSNPRVR